ncbi:MAG: hypothetical protein IPJ03_09000 [Ignavibacteriales bacterium]|nr:hypothetical protein [Ignavibacteriales bacterium]
MKKILLVFASVLVVIVYSSCSKDDSSNNNPIIPGGGTNTTATFTIQQEFDQQQNAMAFLFKPSVDVKLNSGIAGVTSAQFADTVSNPLPDFVFSKDTLYYWPNQYTGVVAGQQWTFTFVGTLVTGGTAFTRTESYTVQ